MTKIIDFIDKLRKYEPASVNFSLLFVFACKNKEKILHGSYI